MSIVTTYYCSRDGNFSKRKSAGWGNETKPQLEIEYQIDVYILTWHLIWAVCGFQSQWMLFLLMSPFLPCLLFYSVVIWLMIKDRAREKVETYHIYICQSTLQKRCNFNHLWRNLHRIFIPWQKIMKSLFYYFCSNKVIMDRFLFITFFCVNWLHLAFSQGRWTMILVTILVLNRARR